MKIVQVRDCDSACCREKPQFPNETGDDCVYRTGGRLSLGCALISKTLEVPANIGDCVTHADEDPLDVLNNRCIPFPLFMWNRVDGVLVDLFTTYPDNALEFYQWKCGGCCLQAVEDDDPRPAYVITIQPVTREKVRGKK